MLDLSKLNQQIHDMTFEFGNQVQELNSKLYEAKYLFREFDKRPEEWISKIDSHDRHFFVAFPEEELSTVYGLPEEDSSYGVFATDGSQIELDTHEAILCYVINTGLVGIYYDGKTPPYLESVPKLFYRDEDIYEYANGGRSLISSSRLSEVRSAIEAQWLNNLISSRKECTLPAVGLVDGTLVSWDRVASAKKDIGAFTAPLFKECFDYGREFGVPIAGYISGSRSSLVVNTLRAKLCHREFMDCLKCDRDVDCRYIEGILDTILFKDILNVGERSTVFYGGINSFNKRQTPEDRIGFFYIHVGDEIARVEAPEYVLGNRELLNLLHFVVFDQAKKGMGYPISLQEAHHLAVVRGGERESFFRLAYHRLMEAGLPVNMTNKKLRKITRLF